MYVKVLLFAPVRSFGELIQQALEETDLYRVTLVHDRDQAVLKVQTQDYPLIILDFDLDPDPNELLESIVSYDPTTRIIAMKERNSDGDPIKPGSHLSKLLNEPFYLPDLIDAVEYETAVIQNRISKVDENRPGFFPSSTKPETKDSGQYPDGLRDPDLVARYISQQQIVFPVQAALMMSEDELLAFGGNLPLSTSQEFAHYVRRFWTASENSDLAQYIRLDSSSKEFMLYTTSLGNKTVIALAFEIDVPFSTIHSIAHDLSSRLKSPTSINTILEPSNLQEPGSG